MGAGQGRREERRYQCSSASKIVSANAMDKRQGTEVGETSTLLTV